MPELPEVDLVARTLDRIIRGKTITAAELRRERLMPDRSPESFAEVLRDLTVDGVRRRGKHILFDLSEGRTLITHLRMSGRFMHLSIEADDPKFAHAVFYFDSGTKLVFDDQRHFGLMKVVETPELYEVESIRKLAPEPLSDEFSLPYLRDKLRSSQRTLKEFLIDQTKVCGLGNIYAAEVMFLARVNPEQRADTLSRPRSALLHEKIRELISDAVALGATLQVDEANISGSIYGDSAASVWNVYDREGGECVVCRSPIRRIRQGGRSTYYCRKCQRRPPVRTAK